ncbi:MAG: winged helix-turn-helix domain-containing protein [Alphaproteobacteria bacterium]|nr:winged helix-turn-helix domain-containing protein [Alphaproteobacteria bacterium]
MNLMRAGFEVLPARDGAEALALAREHRPPVVLLDLMLPDMSGTEICAALREDERTARAFVIMVTARTEEEDRIEGFEVGADDYVTKPFSVKELTLRVKAAARRLAPEEGVMVYGEVRIDPTAHRAWKGGDELVLTATEYRLLQYLAEHEGALCSRGDLLVDVWELPPNLNTRTVDTHIKRLRQKLGDHCVLIETVRGAGYRFNHSALDG